MATVCGTSTIHRWSAAFCFAKSFSCSRIRVEKKDTITLHRWILTKPFTQSHKYVSQSKLNPSAHVPNKSILDAFYAGPVRHSLILEIALLFPGSVVDFDERKIQTMPVDLHRPSFWSLLFVLC